MNADASVRAASKKRTRLAMAAAVVAVAVVGAIAAQMLLQPGTSAAVAPTTTVERGTLSVTVSAEGQTEPAESYDVYPEVAGTVAELHVEVGDTVKAGDVVLTLDEESLRSAVRDAQTRVSQADQQVAAADQQVAAAAQQLASASLQRRKAQGDLDQLRSMTGTVTASARQLEDARRAVAVASAGVTTAKAGCTAAGLSLSAAREARRNAREDLADARQDMERTVVLAPADGVVTQVSAVEGGAISTASAAQSLAAGAGSTSQSMGGDSAGQSAGSSAPVVISDTSVLVATVAVNEVDIADIKKGQQAIVTFDAASGLAIPATVRWVSPDSESSGSLRTYGVELELTRQDERLRPGMTASAEIEALTIEDALLVPKTAVRVDGVSKFVTVMRADGTSEKRTVTTGRSDETSVEILTGLKAGEAVTTSFTAPEKTGSGGFMPPRPPGGMAGNR